MCQKLPVDDFKWKKKILKFNKDYDEDSGKAYILEGDVEYRKNIS